MQKRGRGRPRKIPNVTDLENQRILFKWMVAEEKIRVLLERQTRLERMLRMERELNK